MKDLDGFDRMEKNMKTFAKVGLFIWALYALFILSVVGTLGYCAWHFISKHW